MLLAVRERSESFSRNTVGSGTFRETSPQSRMVLVELAQQLARQRLGHRVARPTTLMHALRTRIGDDDPAVV